MEFRFIESKDKTEVLSMMREFYASDAVFTNGSENIFVKDIDMCISNSPYLEGYVFDLGEIVGYSMLAKSYSTEFGKTCVWIEDIFIKPALRGKKIVSRFMEFVKERYKDCIIRLEVEKDNERAIALYEKYGFTYLPYSEMKAEQ